jgi:hypothetical protein
VLNQPAKPIVTFMQVDTFECWAQLGHALYECDSPEVSKNEDVRPNITSWEAGREKKRKVVQ